MQRLRIDHLTEYRFSTPVTLQVHALRLRPRESHGVRLASSKLQITPTPTIRWQRDTLDNSVALASFEAPSNVLRVESNVVIEHYEEAPLDFIVEPDAVQHPFEYRPEDAKVLSPFTVPTWPDEAKAVRQWVRSLGLATGPMETFVLLDRLNDAIHEGFRYQMREAPGVQSPARTLERGVGSCRDFAALFMEACRSLGLASRFVSGYLRAPVSEVGRGATHAWAEIYLPGPGWKAFDPTAGKLADTDHIAVAVARQPESVPPVAGSFVGPAAERPTLTVGVTVQALDEPLTSS